MATTILVAAAAQMQQPPAQTYPDSNNDLELNWKIVERDIWASAKPYLEDSYPQLEATVPELKGLEADPRQEKLTFILARAGDKCLELLQRMPNVISREEVLTKTPHLRQGRQKFEYLIVSRKMATGVVLEEYRTDKHGGPMKKTSAGPSSQGYASMWVRLFPGNISESRFRYLGQQEMDGHHTFVLAFAQIPNLVKFPAKFRLEGTEISILYQGVAWIDTSDFRIVRMREDLLAPRPDAYLTKFTAEAHFDEVHISRVASPLWLPREANVESDFKGQIVQQRHLYSNYRLYAVKTTILPTAP